MDTFLAICIVLNFISAVPGTDPSIPRRVTRVVHGEVVYPHSHPWQVSLQYQDGFHFCGGTLVDVEWVLTAAHCVQSTREADIRVVLGEHRLSMREGAEQFLNVSYINISPFYNLVRPGFFYYMPHDLAMLRLTSEARLNSFVRTIQLAKPGSTYTGHPCTTAGWGITDDGQTSDVLLQAEMTVLDNFVCKMAWSDFIYYGNICVFNSELTPCEGDSGGPLVCQDQDGPVIVGVSSWGHPDCGDSPAVYTRVTENYGWIRDVIAELD